MSKRYSYIYGRKLNMEKIFCETEEKFCEMQRRYDLEDCGVSGLYPEYHWYQDSNANVAVYRRKVKKLKQLTNVIKCV